MFKKDYSMATALKRRDTISGAPSIGSWDCSAREVHALEFLAGLDAQMTTGEKHLEERLRKTGAWQAYRSARALMEKALDRVYDTVPAKTLRHMVNLSLNGEVVVRAKNPINTTDLQMVNVNDLTLICNELLTDKCRYCLKDPAEQKGCKLRKTFMRVIPPNEVEDGACAYRDIVQEADFEQEEFIKY